ncbi:hypothetical protein [Micromonospora foliorum]|uniref:hypothetical protein n=1 Tax=Micromonospora foliorum TaxID=2911210 RepID=UPI001EE89930|nr:hypothetical protein [Micromonospora foliorum]MCG5435238.1 hypothetical protein [Micromonospora foliorum]
MATVLVGVTSTAAYADTIDSACQPSWDGSGRDCFVNYYHAGVSDLVGHGSFSAHGERLVARDKYADGRGVYVGATWWAGSTQHADGFWLTSGAGAYRELDLSIAEGTSVTLTVCQTDNGNLINCRTQTAIA